MTRRKMISIPLAAIFLAFSRLGSAAQVKDPAPPPIRQIDHIMIRADDPGKLYAFFTEILQLPVAWPMATRGGVTSGGAGFGNVNVEAIRFAEQKGSPAGKPSRSQLVGFGFEPSPLGECLAELDRRGITYGELRPFISTGQDGSKKTPWTNVTLRQFSDSDRPADATMHIFLSEYSPTYVNVEQRRARLRSQLVESGGGPLGVEAVKEVIIGATNLKTATRLWERLLEPRRPSAPGLWQVGDGPAIRLVWAGENTIQGLIISVVSLRRARAFLQERGILGSVSEKEVTIDPSKIQGLNIRLVEKR